MYESNPVTKGHNLFNLFVVYCWRSFFIGLKLHLGWWPSIEITMKPQTMQNLSHDNASTIIKVFHPLCLNLLSYTWSFLPTKDVLDFGSWILFTLVYEDNQDVVCCELNSFNIEVVAVSKIRLCQWWFGHLLAQFSFNTQINNNNKNKKKKTGKLQISGNFTLESSSVQYCKF